MPKREVHVNLFRYRRGQWVTWTGAPAHPYCIAQRRWTERDILGPVVEYLLIGLEEWAYEPDLEPWHVCSTRCP
jgi:hypothetical protein